MCNGCRSRAQLNQCIDIEHTLAEQIATDELDADFDPTDIPSGDIALKVCSKKDWLSLLTCVLQYFLPPYLTEKCLLPCAGRVRRLEETKELAKTDAQRRLEGAPLSFAIKSIYVQFTRSTHFAIHMELVQAELTKRMPEPEELVREGK